MTSGPVGADTALLAALPALRVIASRGVGYETIDLETASRRGIAVSNTPGVLTDCVADLAFGALLAVPGGSARPTASCGAGSGSTEDSP